jgi:hypothetical protein
MGKKVNPRNIPRTQADVDRAREEGIVTGVNYACAMFMNVLLDKFNAQDHVVDIWHHMTKLSEEVKEGRVKIPEIIKMLKDEYDIEL